MKMKMRCVSKHIFAPESQEKSNMSVGFEDLAAAQANALARQKAGDDEPVPYEPVSRLTLELDPEAGDKFKVNRVYDVEVPDPK